MQTGAHTRTNPPRLSPEEERRQKRHERMTAPSKRTATAKQAAENGSEAAERAAIEALIESFLNEDKNKKKPMTRDEARRKAAKAVENEKRSLGKAHGNKPLSQRALNALVERLKR